MIPGPDLVYACPTCGGLLRNGSVASGNTHHAQHFSDGKMFAPMLPVFPDLTACEQCEDIFWLSKLQPMGDFEPGGPVQPDWDAAPVAQFLTIEGYFKALENGLADGKWEAVYIRQKIWWAYNDRVRDNQALIEGEKDELRWRENLQALLALLDVSDSDQRLMAAEIHRNLGAFDKCISLLEGNTRGDLDWLKEAMVLQCHRGNTLVFELDPPMPKYNWTYDDPD